MRILEYIDNNPIKSCTALIGYMDGSSLLSMLDHLFVYSGHFFAALILLIALYRKIRNKKDNGEE